VLDDSPTADLVLRARKGDSDSWDALVERFAPLIWSICRRYPLGRADAEDVGQYVWLRLVDHLDAIHDPAALPGWLVTTTQRECLRALRAARNQQAPGNGPDVESIPDGQTGMAEHELLLAELHAALREAFTRLPPAGQRLIAILLEDPPVPYAEISARLGIPVGSIGPSRGRCLEKLRHDPAIAALVDAGPAAWPPRRGGGPQNTAIQLGRGELPLSCG
jgi:RNA polymerase sigma factor (sigma-70 family)